MTNLTRQAFLDTKLSTTKLARELNHKFVKKYEVLTYYSIDEILWNEIYINTIIQLDQPLNTILR